MTLVSPHELSITSSQQCVPRVETDSISSFPWQKIPGKGSDWPIQGTVLDSGPVTVAHGMTGHLASHVHPSGQEHRHDKGKKGDVGQGDSKGWGHRLVPHLLTGTEHLLCAGLCALYSPAVSSGFPATHHQCADGVAGLAGGRDSAAGCPVFPTAVEMGDCR